MIDWSWATIAVIFAIGLIGIIAFYAYFDWSWATIAVIFAIGLVGIIAFYAYFVYCGEVEK